MVIEPHDFRHRILACLTGVTPQVVTETLFALVRKSDPPFIPTELHLITTGRGREILQDQLLNPGGWLDSLYKDYRISPCCFSEKNLHVLTLEDGTPLEDIRTVEDNTRISDQMLDIIRTLTADPDSAVHLSLAGGRKTMGFIAGYALSLFARPQDRLSHVLVSAPYESIPDFYYPTPKKHIVRSLSGQAIDASLAEVTLAPIPILHLRNNWPSGLIGGFNAFEETVRIAQTLLDPPHLALDLRKRKILAGGKEIDLQPTLLAFLSWFARRAMAGKSPLPCPKYGVPNKAMAEEYLEEYRRIMGEMGDVERTRKTLSRGMEIDFFEQKASKLHRVLKKFLGRGAIPYMIRGEGSRWKRYSLSLDPKAIVYLK